MNEIIEPAIESSRKTVSALGAQAKDRLLAQVRQEPAKTLSIIVAGSVLVAVLLAYRISRMEEESRRRRVLEDGIREVRNWVREHGRNIATPIKGSLDATKSAVEEVSSAGARVGRHLHPFFEKLNRSFLNLF
jgi:hypothetical protein